MVEGEAAGILRVKGGSRKDAKKIGAGGNHPTPKSDSRRGAGARREPGSWIPPHHPRSPRAKNAKDAEGACLTAEG